jgi:hypothetical protein
MMNSEQTEKRKREKENYLFPAEGGRLVTEATTAHVEAVLSDDTVGVLANTAER